MNGAVCALNFCGCDQGDSTWVAIAAPDHDYIVPVCEEHWQAVRTVT